MTKDTKKYILTKEQLKTLLHEAMLLSKLRNLAMDCSFVGNVTVEEFKEHFFETKEKLKLLKIDYYGANKLIISKQKKGYLQIPVDDMEMVHDSLRKHIFLIGLSI